MKGDANKIEVQGTLQTKDRLITLWTWCPNDTLISSNNIRHVQEKDSENILTFEVKEYLGKQPSVFWKVPAR